jgi:hypothetical protein
MTALTATERDCRVRIAEACADWHYAQAPCLERFDLLDYLYVWAGLWTEVLFPLRIVPPGRWR